MTEAKTIMTVGNAIDYYSAKALQDVIKDYGNISCSTDWIMEKMGNNTIPEKKTAVKINHNDYEKIISNMDMLSDEVNRIHNQIIDYYTDLDCNDVPERNSPLYKIFETACRLEPAVKWRTNIIDEILQKARINGVTDNDEWITRNGH